MNWKSVPPKEKDAAIKRIAGKTIKTVIVTVLDNSVKEVVLDLGDEKIRFTQTYYSNSIDVSLPAQTHILNGSVKLGSLRAVIDPEEFNTEQEAKDRMKELLKENDTFEGVATVVAGV